MMAVALVAQLLEGNRPLVNSLGLNYFVMVVFTGSSQDDSS